MIHLIHKGIMELIRSLPMRQSLLGFRIYHKIVRNLAPEFRARTYFGARLYCDPHDLIQCMILYFGVWEPDISQVIEGSLSPGDVFVDIGANIGYDAMLGSMRVGRAGAVVAIEASPSTFALLERNIALNSAANVRAVHAAVSDRRSRLELYEPYAGNIGAATTLASRGGRQIASVEAVPLEEILTPAEIGRVRLIKLDVEGAEPPILMRLVDHLALYPPDMELVVEASPADDPQAWHEVFRRLRSAGFRVFAIENSYDLEWYLARRRPGALQELREPPTEQQDLLFTRNDRR